MPIYEYSCPACGNEFETIHKVSDPAPPCPTCGEGVEKKISLAAFHLKGGGWYADAYAGKDNKPSGGSDSGTKATSTSSSSSTGSSDSSSSSASTPSSTSTSSPTTSASSD